MSWCSRREQQEEGRRCWSVTGDYRSTQELPGGSDQEKLAPRYKQSSVFPGPVVPGWSLSWLISLTHLGKLSTLDPCVTLSLVTAHNVSPPPPVLVPARQVSTICHRTEHPRRWCSAPPGVSGSRPTNSLCRTTCSGQSEACRNSLATLAC